MKYRIIQIGAILIAAVSISIFAGSASRKKSPQGPGSYRIGANGEYYPETNIAELWPGIWKDGTNGFRVQLFVLETNTPNPWVSVAVGSVVMNSGAAYYAAPDGNFAEFTLRHSNGDYIPPRKGVVMESQHESKIRVNRMPRWGDGALRDLVGFRTNSPPRVLKEFHIHDVYDITNAGDYVLTVRPVIYKIGTNEQYLDCVDLPSVAAPVHLLPTESP